jgi:hypothetical protein
MLFSLFQQDYSNLILFVGVIMTCFFTIVVGAALPKKTNSTPDMVCSPLRLPSGERLSGLPLSLAVYSYIYCYFAVPIFENKLQSQNVLFLCFFPLLLLFDIIWLRMFQCASYIRIILGGLVGVSVGLSWGEIVYQMDMRSIQSESRYNQCHKPTPVATADISSKQPSRYLCVKRWRTKMEPVTQPPVENFQNPFKESLQGGFQESLQGGFQESLQGGFQESLEGDMNKKLAKNKTIKDACEKSKDVITKVFKKEKIILKIKENYPTTLMNNTDYVEKIDALLKMMDRNVDKKSLSKQCEMMIQEIKDFLDLVKSRETYDLFMNNNDKEAYDFIIEFYEKLQLQYNRFFYR